MVLLSVTIITLDQTGRAHFFTSGSKSLASDIYGPLRSGVNGIIDPIGRFFAGAVHYGALEQENEKLRAEVGSLEQAEGQFAAAGRRYRQLQQLLTLDKLPALSSLPKVDAQVISGATSPFAATVTINKGRSDGVVVGDAVVGAGGLVGQVVFASAGTATVRLVTDGQSDVGVVYGSNENATLVGQGAGKPLDAELISTTTAVSAGQEMTTSGLQGAAYPPGIPVAKVASVKTVAGAADKVVTATPVADLNGLTYVSVVQWSPSP